jgi:hypothetical protein
MRGKYIRIHSPEAKAKRSEIAKRIWANPELRAKKSEAQKKAFSSPEYKAKRSEISKKIWSNPETRAKLEKAAQNRSPEWREKQAKRKRDNPEQIAKLVKGMKIYWSNTENKMRQSEIVKKRFSNPEERIKLSKIMKEISCDYEWIANSYQHHIKRKARKLLLQLENNVPLDEPNRDEIIRKLQITRMNIKG